MASFLLGRVRVLASVLACGAAVSLGCGPLEPGPVRNPGVQAGSGGSTDSMAAAGASGSEPNATAPGGVTGSTAPGGTSEPSLGTDGGGAADGGSTAPPAPGASGSDDIFGTQVPRSESWWVEQGRIHQGGREVVLKGLNWFGLDGTSRALFGPAEARRSVQDFLNQMKSLGFNALRVPLAPESIKPGFASADWANHGTTDTGREHFEVLAAAAKNAGVYMLWDVHTCAAAVGHMKNGPADPACGGYGIEDWTEDLRTLARLAESYAPYVLGIDLFNEPYALTYEAWRALVEDAGRAVLELNPRILVFVEGVGNEGYQGSYGVFWGENLTGVAQDPVRLPASRLVYSPHAYGPSVFAQSYFDVADFPSNMPEIWDEHFGYLMDGTHAVVPGEFGGFYTGQDRVWQDAFVDYLLEKDSRSFFYWCLNPNSGDTGGLLLDDWRTVNQDKLTLLQRLMN